MDWTMVSNSKDSIDRVRAIFYLFKFRYEANASAAGKSLAHAMLDNPLCRQAILDLRTELACPSSTLGMVNVSDRDARDYLRTLLIAYDEQIESSSNETT
jgi:hypothetical protein